MKEYAQPHDFVNRLGWRPVWRTLGLGEGQFARRFENERSDGGMIYCWFAWDDVNCHMLSAASSADLERLYEER